MPLRLQWDRKKARSNEAKYGISFAQATTAFLDPLARIFDDHDHSASEAREILVGHDEGSKLLVERFAEREGVVRLFSARAATARERHDDEENCS